MTVDIEDLKKFAAELRGSATAAAAASRKVVTKGAQDIKTDSRKLLRAQMNRHGRRSSLDWLPVAITYDITSGDAVTEAEIGPDQAISGLGLGTEYGSVHHAPMPFMGPAFDMEAPKFEAALEDAVLKAFGA